MLLLPHHLVLQVLLKLQFLEKKLSILHYQVWALELLPFPFGGILVAEPLLLLDLKLEHLSKLASCLRIVHLDLGHHFSKRLSMIDVLVRVDIRIRADIDKLSLLQQLGVLDLLHSFLSAALELVHLVLSPRSIFNPVLESCLLKTVPLIWSIQTSYRAGIILWLGQIFLRNAII